MSQQPIIAPAKPIVVIRIYSDTLLRQHNEIIEALEKKFYDYHVLVLASQDNDIEIETFYEKDITAITFNELYKKVEESINQMKNDTRIPNQ